MLKPLQLLAACCCALLSYSQKTDTLLLFYKPDQYSISKQDKQKLDSFLIRNWDRVSINGYTDETDDDDHNMELSKKRSGEVYQYLLSKTIAANNMSSQYFGETMPRGDNSTDEGRSLNRRTEIIGYQFARISLKPKTDPMKPVTSSLDNGLIITYRPGSLPDYMAANFASGSGMDLQMITNTAEMRQYNLYNNTTAGEILSSVMILCSGRIEPCKVDSPVLIRVPFPAKLKCPVQKVKFFVAVSQNGKRIWEEQQKTVFTEVVGGTTYMSVWVDNFCGCINFDFKVPECFETDSAKLFVKSDIRNLSAELTGLNSVYLPRKVNDSTHSLLYEKGKPENTTVSFALYNGKRRIKTFGDQSLSTLPYDTAANEYRLSTGDFKFSFPKVKVFNVVLKVNKDRYFVYPEKDKCGITYLNRKTENILVDFSVADAKGRLTFYKNQPIEAFPYDEMSGCRIIDKNLLKVLKEKGAVAGR